MYGGNKDMWSGYNLADVVLYFMGGSRHMIYEKMYLHYLDLQTCYFHSVVPRTLELQCIFEFMCLLLRIQYGAAVKIFV